MKLINDQTVKILKKYFVFDQIFDLCQYDLNNMYQLYSDLSKLKKTSYSQNYRFVFLHYETEYYFDKSYPGLTLINLQRVLASLDISNYFCLVLSQQDISDKLKFLQKHETTDQTAIDSLKYQNYWWTGDHLLPRVDKTIKIHSEKISKNYLFLNRKTRFHRRVFFSLLKDNELLDKGVVSYLGVDESKSPLISELSSDIHSNKNLCFLETSTHTRVNDRWLLHNAYIKKCVDNVPARYFFKNFDEATRAYYLNLLLGQQCFLHIVSETVYNYPCSFLTEKSIKAMVCKRPFVIIGPPGSISNLKSLGFNTFDRWWDESYDQIENNEERMLAILKIVKQIYQKDILSLQDICNEMKDTLEYNFDFFINHFEQSQIDSLHQFCKNNLKIRYN